MRLVLLFLVSALTAWGQVSGGVVAVRDSATGAIVPQIGDTSNSAMRVNVVAGSGSGVSHVDDAPFTAGTDDIVPAGGFFNDSSPDSVDEGDAGLVRMSANRNLYMTIRDSAGNERGVTVDATNRLSTSVDNNPVLGAGSSNIGDVDVLTMPGTAAEDAALPSVFVVIAGDDGTDTQAVQLSATGDLKVTLDSETVAATQSGTWTVQPGNTPNTTPWVVETISYNSCGATLQDTTQVDVATGGGSAMEATTTCVESIYITNKTASPCTVQIQDAAGTPVVWVGGTEDFSVPAASTIRWDFDGKSFTDGVTVIAGTASCLNASLMGVQ